MESSTPYREQPLPVQHASGSTNKDKLQENDFEQISSQTLLDFLPSIHNVPKGSLDLPDFNLTPNENLHREDIHSSLEANEGCSLSLNPFSAEHHLGDESLPERPDFMHIGNTSSESRNILPNGSNYLETSRTATSHQLQRSEISLSSHIFSKNLECSENILSGFSGSMLPFHTTPDNDDCSKLFIAQEDVSKHIGSDHSLKVMESNVMLGKINEDCDKNDINVNVDAANNTQIFSETSPNNYSSELDMKNTSNQKLNSQSDLFEHMGLLHTPQEMQVQGSIMTCAFCPKMFKTPELLIKHEALHPYQTSAIQCSKCGEILGNYMLLQEHKQYEDYLSSCDICGQLFPNEECMMCHIRNSHNDFEDIFDEECNISQELQVLENVSTEKAHSNQSSESGEVLKDGDNLATAEPDFACQSPLGLESPNMDVATQSVNECEDPGVDQSDPEKENFDTPDEPLDGLCLEPAASESSLLETGVYPEELPNTFDDQNDNSPAFVPIKPRKTKCQFCSKKCSTRKSLVRHERSHPYGTAAMKCNLCLEIVENYKAMKVHKKHQGTQVSCSTCNQVCPNDKCLTCHVRNVHNNSVYEVQPTFDVNDSNEDDYDLEEEGESDSGAPAAQQYSVSRFTVSDSGAPLRITIKQEKEEVHNEQASPPFWASTPPTPSTPSPQGPPTPSPPLYVYESEPEPSDEEDDQEYAPYDSDQSIGSESKTSTKRKSSLRSTRKSSTNSAVLLSSEESDHDESADFSYTPQSNSESEIDSDNDPDWGQDENSWGGSKKRSSRKKNLLSDDDSDVDPDWKRAAIFSGNSKKRGSRKRGPYSDDSDNDVDWRSAHNTSGSIKKKRKRSPHSEDDSDYDPDWNRDYNPSGSIKKKVPGKRGRKKKLQVAFFLPAIPVPKVKRPRARGLGGQKAQDAAAALAQAVEDMETTVPEFKTVIKPVRRSVTKASLKRYNETLDDEYDYLLDVKPEPKEGSDDPENMACSPQDTDSPGSQSNSERYQLNSESCHSEATPNTHGKTWDQQEEQIVIKAEPYDFQDDDLSEGTDLYFSKKFCEPDLKYGNSSSPSKVESEADESPSSKKELRYACKICGRALQYRSHLVRHLRRVHGGEGVEEVMRRLMKCRFCEKPYSNELSLINHEKLHDGTSKMKCNKCEERFDDKNALRRHQRKMHWEHQPVECDICKKQLSDNTCLKAHMKHMHGADEKKVTVFTCETCGRQLHTKTAFQNHVASKCGTNLLFPCETCGKSFSFKGSLKAHQLLHTGVKSFLCKFCGKAFHQKGEMKRHERKHTGEKPFVCEVCGRAFAYRESLLGHSAVHTGIKPFPCKTCGMRFSCSGNLVKHRRSNNCKGSGEQGETAGAENTQENLNVNDVLSVDKPCIVIPETITKLPLNNISLTNEVHSLSSENSSMPESMQETLSVASEAHNLMTDHALKNKQESVHLVTQSQQIDQTIAVSSGQSHSSQLASVIKSAPGINVKPTSALQASAKEMKPPSHVDVSQSYSISGSTSNRLTDHLNSVYDRHENTVTGQSSYSSHNLVSSYSDNHFRQTNQVGVTDRRYSQFSMDGYPSRTDQYFDRQSLMRHEMSRQVMERTVDRQTPRFLDCFGGVQFSGVDSRNSMQSYPAPALPLPASGYPNIHSGHLGNYAAAHTANHSSNHANMYGGNTMMPGPVSFPGFAANNHIGMGYAPNNPIPAHSVAHSSSYPASHMSHLEALFGHFSQNAANNSFQRLSSHNVGPPGNPSLPSNHRV